MIQISNSQTEAKFAMKYTGNRFCCVSSYVSAQLDINEFAHLYYVTVTCSESSVQTRYGEIVFGVGEINSRMTTVTPCPDYKERRIIYLTILFSWIRTLQ